LRPKMAESVAKRGEVTVAATRNEITSQNDCRAVPPSVDAMVWPNYQYTQSDASWEGMKIPAAQQPSS
jgi:hypothetical protein